MATVSKAKRDKIISALHDARGKVTLAVQQLRQSGMDISRSTFYRYVNQYASIQHALDEARMEFDEDLVDAAEWRLRQAVMSGEQWAIKYALSTKGKLRGYSERQEVTGADGDDLRITVSYTGITDDDGHPD